MSLPSDLALGQQVHFEAKDGTIHGGTLAARITVGELVSYDVACGDEVIIVAPAQLLEHPAYKGSAYSTNPRVA